jgi:hypothetical protein
MFQVTVRSVDLHLVDAPTCRIAPPDFFTQALIVVVADVETATATPAVATAVTTATAAIVNAVALRVEVILLNMSALRSAFTANFSHC